MRKIVGAVIVYTLLFASGLAAGVQLQMNRNFADWEQAVRWGVDSAVDLKDRLLADIGEKKRQNTVEAFPSQSNPDEKLNLIVDPEPEEGLPACCD